MAELLWTCSVQAFIRRRMLKSPQEKGKGKEMKKKYNTRERESERDDVKMLNQEIMWQDAFRLKLRVYIAAEVPEKDCMEKKH